MTNINTRNLGAKINIDQTRQRQTPKTDFGTVLKTGLSKTADIAMSAGAIAAPFIPGGAVVSAAISGVSQMKDTLGRTSGAATSGTTSGPNSLTIGGGSGSTSSLGGSSSGSIGTSTGSTTSTSGNSSQFSDFKEMQEWSMSQNMQYLAIQRDMQDDNRRFTLTSNIMKVKHDTAKNAINNVR